MQGLGAFLIIYLCDTCVLIDYLRGKTEVQQKLEQDKGLGLGMSSITYMELMVGATALELGLPLYTTNIKDFQFIPDLVLV